MSQQGWTVSEQHNWNGSYGQSGGQSWPQRLSETVASTLESHRHNQHEASTLGQRQENLFKQQMDITQAREKLLAEQMEKLEKEKAKIPSVIHA